MEDKCLRKCVSLGGSATHDMAVLRDCWAEQNFPHPPPRRYYLVDAGYALEYGYMGPFKNTRYHPDDFRDVPVETLTRQEKFNLTHSRLRNVIERTFGVLKRRWQILDGVPYCEREKQNMIIMSCFAMHNYLYIRDHGLGSPTYTPGAWLQLNANNSMTAQREYISLAIWRE